MRKQPRPTADAVPAAVGAPTASIESLVANGRDLKGELVAFAKSPRFSKLLTARLRSGLLARSCGFDRRGGLTGGVAVSLPV